MKTRCFLAGLLIAAFVAGTCHAQLPASRSGDWPWWRGPSSSGVAEPKQRAPVAWSETENVAWKVPLPGRGHSSPTVVGNRVFLTTADDQDQVQSILCFDRDTGERIWKHDANRGGFPDRIHRKNTHASGSVACDGAIVFATFYNHQGIQIVAVDVDGNPVWQRVAGEFAPNQYKHGYGASPLLYGDWVIVVGDFDGDAFLVAHDRKTGKQIWKTKRPSLINYASPVVADVAGRHQLLISGCDVVASYDPLSGKQLWEVDATTMATVGTMVWEGDLVFASGGYPDPGTVCIRADGSGEVVWQNNHKCYEQSMLVVDGYVYAINDTGIALCWNARTGEEQWRERLRGPISSSPTLSGGLIYGSSERGTTWVYRANPDKFELVKQNQLGTEAFATPVICGDQIFLRVADSVGDNRQEMLYCIEKT